MSLCHHGIQVCPHCLLFAMDPFSLSMMDVPRSLCHASFMDACAGAAALGRGFRVGLLQSTYHVQYLAMTANLAAPGIAYSYRQLARFFRWWATLGPLASQWRMPEYVCAFSACIPYPSAFGTQYARTQALYAITSLVRREIWHLASVLPHPEPQWPSYISNHMSMDKPRFLKDSVKAYSRHVYLFVGILLWYTSTQKVYILAIVDACVVW